MNFLSLIEAKREGKTLAPEQIQEFIREFTAGKVPDYQMAALLMAIFFRGLNTAETTALTLAMRDSGDILKFPRDKRPLVDKHSTGGIGDKVSRPLAPLLACLGFRVPMISGRGLGHTGGTLDKLESIPGFRVNLSLAEYRAQLEKSGLALIGQTAELAPADKKLYALRDVTGTVESIPLICASILSKKLAEGIAVLGLAVKFGRGAVRPEKVKARELALALVAAATAMGKPTRAVMTAMEQPLGRTVGNALEVAESIDCLKGRGPVDTMEVTYAIGEQMLLLAGVAKTKAAARAQLEASIAQGTALEKFRAMVSGQGGDGRVVDKPGRLPQARLKVPLVAARAGFVQSVDAMGVALAALRLGAGRAKAADPVDHAVGVSELAKVGERIEAGAPFGVIHANDESALAEAQAMLAKAIVIGDTAGVAPKLIDEVIG